MGLGGFGSIQCSALMDTDLARPVFTSDDESRAAFDIETRLCRLDKLGCADIWISK